MTNDNRDADLAQMQEQVKLLTGPQMAGSLLGFWIFGWMMLWAFMSIGTLGAGLYKQYFFHTAVMTEGTITEKSSELYRSSRLDANGQQRPVDRTRDVVSVTFKLADGQTVTTTQSGGYDTAQIGDVIDVWYNPAWPKDIRLAQDKETANLLCMASAGGTLLVALCWFLLRVFVPRQQGSGGVSGDRAVN